MRAVLVSLLAAMQLPLSASADPAAQSGSYEITYRLELPHIESNDETTRAVCLANAGVDGGSAFPVLSENNPLAHCPASNLRRSGDDFSFDIVCPGGNAAQAHARYTMMDGRFQGSITMNMGGKNMTMTEVQRGKRLGECSAAAPKSH